MVTRLCGYSSVRVPTSKYPGTMLEQGETRAGPESEMGGTLVIAADVDYTE